MKKSYTICSVLLLILTYTFVNINTVSGQSPAKPQSQQQQSEKKLVPAVKFQTDGLPSNASYIRAKESLPRLDALSFCVHIHLYHARDALFPLISYSRPEFSDELLVYLDVILGTLQMVCCGGEGRLETMKILATVPIFVWMHLCLIIDLRLLRYKVFANGNSFNGDIISSGDRGLNIEEGGILIMGQEQDLFGGGFSIQQSFEGILAGPTISFGITNDEVAERFSRCENNEMEDVLVSFDDFSTHWTANGAVEVMEIQKVDICRDKETEYVMFPEPRSLDDSIKMCKKLKGRIALPTNAVENTRLTVVASTKLSQCSVGWGVFLWLGMRATRGKDDLWDYRNVVTNEIANYTNFRAGYNNPISTYECIYLDSFETSFWVQYPCIFKTCVACAFNTPTVLRFRGLCEDTNIDRYYVISGEYNDKPLFSGVSHSVIRATNSTWELIDTLNPEMNATMLVTERNQNPLGLRKWIVYGDKCDVRTPELLLTACQAHQYTCNDGTCIDKMQRCDLQVNCPDQSDERLCIPVVVPGDYIKEVPPARIGMVAAPVNVQVDILSLQPVDILNMKLELTIKITLVWRDPRVDMESLNYDDNLNVILESSELWQPKLLFEDQYQSEARNERLWSDFRVLMESKPLADDITRVREDEVYPGESNSLKLIESFSLTFYCPMNLVAYPFDTQNCVFLIRLKDVPNDFVKLQHGENGVNYLGPQKLREYAVKKVDIFSDDRGNYSGKGIRISLENLSGFYVSTTYIPTFLMVAICYSTFYFNLDDFNDRIMVSLTALLVLATLFTQITETTPKTAYLKLLDVWFVSTILIDFFVVVTLVTVNYFKIKEGFEDFNVTTPVISFKKHPQDMYPKQEELPRLSTKINYYARWAIPLLVALFVFIYVVIAVWIM